MDATGAGTSAGPAEAAGSAEDATAGPPRPVGRADATGPLPVQPPAAPTGPLPASPPGSWFDPGAATDTATETAAQPVAPNGSPPSWFATGPLPAVPTGPEVATPPAGAAAPQAAPGPPPVPVDQSGPAPAGLFEPAAGPQPTVPTPTPPTAAIPVVDPQVPAGTDPTGDIPVVPAPTADPSPPTGAIPVPPPTGAPPAPAGLFTPATPPVNAPAGPGAPADLFSPADPPQQPAMPSPPEPPTGLFAAVAPPPPAAPAPAAPPMPAEPARFADATGPMPAVAAAAGPPAVHPPPAGPAGPPPPPPAPEAPPRTDAWSFPPAPAQPAGTDPWSPPSDDRRPGAAQPLTTPAAGGHAAGLTMVTGSKTATTQSKRRAWPLTVVGVLVAVAAGIALVFSVARTNPADLATTAASDAGGWPGAHYQGTVAAIDGGEIRFDLTVTADGASGTLSRDGGQATAELLWDQDGSLIRANREWWLYHHPTRADDLADTWVAQPDTETQEIDPVLHLNGTALADYVRGGQPSQWQALEQQLVEGRSGIVLFDGARRVVVGSEDTHPLVALDVAPNASTPPVPVSRPTDEQIAAVTGAAARVRQEAGPRTLAQLLQERPNVGIQLQPDPLCTAETCNVTVTVTNSGTAPARGRLEVSADGKVVANHPLDVQPGQVATFTAGAPNPQFAQPGASGRILWETRAVDD
ncbi:hypothetical protein [Pseudonocardia sp. DLS-67]